MIYHFGYVLYEHGNVTIILSVCKGRLKLYYYKCSKCYDKDFAEESKELPLKTFNWEDFENKNYTHYRSYTQMSFVFFGVKKDVEGNNLQYAW